MDKGGKALKEKWYVLYTAPRAEKQVCERLKEQEVECWLPLHRSPRVWSDRVKLVDIPLFPSYLFVRTNEHHIHTLLRQQGVSRVIYYNGKPATIRQKEIDAIEEFLEQASEHPLLPGDEVEILCGAMKNVSGKVKKIKKKYLLLYLEPLGATVCVKLNDVAPVKRLR
ncbi:transcription antitermination factor NusG [Parabacteroides sp. PFB2-12]|uniref:UpxY family transcription antiterminator n=1 Tax=unclassified Parabacteroides TaxID=2649774 RepID=UPI002474FABB|nr:MULTISPECIES: UpxY family transcription antiterminator [unclassified Parabacteroides]MDH6342427.1 transcription antitermination factor NusG [Parabacteroides sp. PM6-13]MDH6390079.1 transcription antitermination factor NusG [Parabacteroides sp. PFB2-12]MDL2309563.1 UpxY family transcription antiterminator [Parabacteroides sp. OttesenSCG-928-B22]